MDLIRVSDYDEMSKTARKMVADLLNDTEKPVLGLATGSTPEGLYEGLINTFQNGNVSFAETTTFNLDEYVGLKPSDVNSYHHYMNERFFKHVDLPIDQAHLPNGAAADVRAESKDYDQLVKQAGPVNLQLLGIGENGHIGFNEPGTSFDSRTQIVSLNESTRQANARFFNSMGDVPTEAITMGIQTIMEAERIIMLISGPKKADALFNLMNGDVTESFPASVLQTHPNVVVIADEAACARL